MRTYQELALNERIEIQQRLESGDSLRAIARSLGRAPSTISRERGRHAAICPYRVQTAQRRARASRCKARVPRKLNDPARFAAVQRLLRLGWSPQQVAGILRNAFPDDVGQPQHTPACTTPVPNATRGLYNAHLQLAETSTDVAR